MSEQQEDISAQVVAAAELLLEELILLGGKWSGELLRCAGKVGALDQVGQFGMLFGPGQITEK